MNVLGILCTSAGAQNFAEGLRRTGNDVSTLEATVGA